MSIVNGYYDSQKSYSIQVTYKSLENGEQLIKDEIKDPISYCEELVHKLNFEKQMKQCKEITDKAPIKYRGQIFKNLTRFFLKIRKACYISY